MGRIELHELPGDKRAGELVRLVDRMHRSRRRIVVWVADPGRLQMLDDFLWTYDKLAFIPHAVWTDGADVADETVVLTSEAVNP